MKAPGTIEPHLIDPEEPSVRPGGTRHSQFPELDDDGTGKGNRYWWVWLLIFALVGYGCYRLYVFENARKEVTAKKKGAMRPRTIPVAVASAHRGDMPVYLQGLGTVTAFNTVTVKTRVDGQLINISFHEGQFVNKGDLLAEIDPRPYQVALDQAKSMLAQAQVTLAKDQ